MLSFFAELPAAVWRAKGFTTIDGKPTLIQYSTGGLDLSPADGTGQQRLVFIGREMDRDGLAERWCRIHGAAKGH